MSEAESHGPSCPCPWCHSERLTYWLLARGVAEHGTHNIPECPAEVER